MQHGSIVVAGISATFLLLALTYINVYTFFVLRRKEYENFKQKQQWASMIAEERDRLMEEIASDVHDNIGQLTHVLRMSYHRMFKDIDESLRLQLRKDAGELIDRIAYHARNIRYTLDSDFIRSRGLLQMLRRDGELIEKAGLTSCRVAVKGLDSQRLDDDKKMMVYRVAQEALHNALKHANAKHIDISLHYGVSWFTLDVQDDGIGFDMEKANKKGGIGLVNMRKRAGHLGGTLSIDTASGTGTKIQLKVHLSTQ